MLQRNNTIGVVCLCTFLCGLGAVSLLHSDPIFVPTEDQSACEGNWLIFSVFADALFPEDELEFEMEGAPEGTLLENWGKCG